MVEAVAAAAVAAAAAAGRPPFGRTPRLLADRPSHLLAVRLPSGCLPTYYTQADPLASSVLSVFGRACLLAGVTGTHYMPAGTTACCSKPKVEGRRLARMSEILLAEYDPCDQIVR